MFTFEATRWVPKFILNDKNGYALAMAIQAGMQSMNNIVRQGLDCITNIETMPEWRLDELAWELNCLYDYDGPIASKRDWIANALPNYALRGTPQAIYSYLSGVFENVRLEEWFDYNGSPYHFRVTVAGAWSQAAENWARIAVDAARNVRSVLDGIIFDGGASVAEGAVGTAATSALIADHCDAV